MAVVAIGIVMLTVSVISLAATARSYQVSHAADVFTGQARLARMLARTEHQRYRVALDSQQAVYIQRLESSTWNTIKSTVFPSRTRVRASSITMPVLGPGLWGYDISPLGKVDASLEKTGFIVELDSDPSDCRCVMLDNFLTARISVDGPPCTVGAETCN